MSTDGPTPGDLPDGVDASGLPAVVVSRRRSGAEGDVEVEGVDEQAEHPVELSRWVALARAVLHDEGVRGDAELSVSFVDEAPMAELNQRFMGVEGPTDVLAFPIDDPIEAGRRPDGGSNGPDREPVDAGDLPLLLGDVVICPGVAARQAADHAGGYDDELALLVVHGALHILGHDHAEPEERVTMQSRERELLDRFHHHR